MSHIQGLKERRAFERFQGPCPSYLVTQDGDALCQVLNLSCAGAQLTTPQPLMPDSRVTLQLDNLGSFPGTVVWSIGFHSGIRFEKASPEIARYLGVSFACLDGGSTTLA